MKLFNAFRSEMTKTMGWGVEAIDLIIASIMGSWQVEHRDDDSHKDIHADSLTLRTDNGGTASITGTGTINVTGTAASSVGGNFSAWVGVPASKTTIGLVGGVGVAGDNPGILMGNQGWIIHSNNQGSTDWELRFIDQKVDASNYVARFFTDNVNYFFSPGSVVNAGKPLWLGEDASGKRWDRLNANDVRLTNNLMVGTSLQTSASAGDAIHAHASAVRWVNSAGSDTRLVLSHKEVTILSASNVTAATGSALLAVFKEETNGGAACALWEQGSTPVILGQVGLTTWVTGAPAAGEVRILDDMTGLSLRAGSSRNNDVVGVSWLNVK